MPLPSSGRSRNRYRVPKKGTKVPKGTQGTQGTKSPESPQSQKSSRGDFGDTPLRGCPKSPWELWDRPTNGN